MYASSSCYNNGTIGYKYGDSTCESTNWLLDTSNWFWTVSPSSTYSSGAMLVLRYGRVSSCGPVDYYYAIFSSGGLRQSLYLDTNVNYVSGDGTSDNPFVIQ